MFNPSPIGVFDSGLGGLSVFSEIIRILPHESIIYYGDGKNCPYGEKPKDEILRISDGIVSFLIGKGCKLIVLACNTATADAIEFLREKYPNIPFVGMEPAVKPAALSTKTGVVGILATAPTLDGKLFRETTAKYVERVKILPVVGERFVDIVESNIVDTPDTESHIRKVIEPLIEMNADKIVLGCTHYPFLNNVIEKIIAGRDIEIINPAPAVARRVRDILSEKGIFAPADNLPCYTYYTSSDDDYLRRIRSMAGKVTSEWE